MKVNNYNDKMIAGIRGTSIWNREMNKAVYSYWLNHTKETSYSVDCDPVAIINLKKT